MNAKRSRAPFPMIRNERPEPFNLKSQSEFTTNFQKQDECLKMSFSEGAKTMLQVSFETGILRANICRFVSKQRKQDRIQLVKVGLCPITKCRAGFYSTGKASDV
jgi:hypothetical protein